jgi:hypothetical protein
MKNCQSSHHAPINLTRFLKTASVFLVCILGFISIAATGGGGDGGKDGTEGVNNDNSVNECSIDYDSSPGCNGSDEACSMAIRINSDRKNHPDESDCAPAIKWSTELAAIALAIHGICANNELWHTSLMGRTLSSA